MPKPKVEQDDDEIKDEDVDESEESGDESEESDEPKSAKPAVKGRRGAHVAARADVGAAETEIDITELWEDRAMETKEALAKQPKVRIMIPLREGEPLGSVQEFNINGYRIAVRKNVMVDVPQQIADMISERYNIEQTAGSNMRLDRAKPGLDEALS